MRESVFHESNRDLLTEWQNVMYPNDPLLSSHAKLYHGMCSIQFVHPFTSNLNGHKEDTAKLDGSLPAHFSSEPEAPQFKFIENNMARKGPGARQDAISPLNVDSAWPGAATFLHILSTPSWTLSIAVS